MNDTKKEDYSGSRWLMTLFLKESRNLTVYFSIKYVLYKFCVTVGRLAPVHSGRLKIYSQYLVNSSVILYWVQMSVTSFTHYFPLCL